MRELEGFYTNAIDSRSWNAVVQIHLGTNKNTTRAMRGQLVPHALLNDYEINRG
jgi:hypothetical protein